MAEGDPNRQHKRRGRKITVSASNSPHQQFARRILDFIELPQFTRRWEKLGLDVEHDLLALQLLIMAEPKQAPVIAGTEGIRKLRFAPDRWNVGTSGGARVLYAFFERFGLVVLCIAYGKDEVEDLSPAVKQFLRKAVVEIEQELERRKMLGTNR